MTLMVGWGILTGDFESKPDSRERVYSPSATPANKKGTALLRALLEGSTNRLVLR
jgi:hypothetical protein